MDDTNYQAGTRDLNQTQVASGNQVGKVFYIRGANGFSYQTKWNNTGGATETLAGSWLVEISNDPKASPDNVTTGNGPTGDTEAAQWFDVTSQLPIVDPTSGASNGMIIASDVRACYVRMTFTYSSGTGDLQTWFMCKGMG